MVSPICIHKMPFTHPQHTTMNKQLKNMMESMAPLPPSVEVFMGFVATAIANDLQGPQVDPLFGEIGHVDSGKPRGSAKNEIVGLRMAEEFTNACKAMDPPVSFTDVDDWMVSLAKYVLHVDVLFDTEEQRAQCLERRNVIGGGTKGRNLSPGTFRTYINALFRAVKEVQGPLLVSSCLRTFPRFNDLMRTAVRRCEIKTRWHKA